MILDLLLVLCLVAIAIGLAMWAVPVALVVMGALGAVVILTYARPKRPTDG